MSLLLIFLPPRPRDGASDGLGAEHAYVLSTDGTSPTRQGQAAAALLPRADTVVAVLPDAEVSWQRLAVPKAPAARLRAALGAMLEDQLLEDDESLHLALAPQLGPGQTGWVAVVHKPWFAAALARLEAAGVVPTRAVPPAWPDAAQTQAHLLPGAMPGTDGAEPVLVLSGPEGVSRLMLAGGLARQRLASVDRQALRATAHPAAVAAAERLLEMPVVLLGDAERALEAARSGWNLRQFDLAPRHRGLAALREAWTRVRSAREWRALRWGVVALVAVQLIGLNAYAWRLERTVADRQAQQTLLLKSAHPQVRSVLSAPLQMQSETDALRAAAGRPGPADLEALLGAAARAWPDGLPPPAALRFEPGRLNLLAPGLAEPQRAALADGLRSAGYRVEGQGEQLTIVRGERR